MRVIVCGGRNYNDHVKICESLNAMHHKHGIDLIIEGGANGADAHAATWATNNEVPRCTFHANWKKLGKRAGPVRNENMIVLGKGDCLIAFSGGIGTKSMTSLARKHGLLVWEVKP